MGTHLEASSTCLWFSFFTIPGELCLLHHTPRAPRELRPHLLLAYKGHIVSERRHPTHTHITMARSSRSASKRLTWSIAFYLLLVLVGGLMLAKTAHAQNQVASNPHRTIFDIKRLIGQKFKDKSVQNDIKHFPFKVVNKNGQPNVGVEVHGE